MCECVIEDSSGMCSLHRLGEEYVCVCVCGGGGGGGQEGGVFCCDNLYYGSFFNPPVCIFIAIDLKALTLLLCLTLFVVHRLKSLTEIPILCVHYVILNSN